MEDNRTNSYKKIKLGKRKQTRSSTTNKILVEYDELTNISKMLSKIGYILKSKQVEDNENQHLSSILCENVHLLEENNRLNNELFGMNQAFKYREILSNSYRVEINRLKRRISYLQRGYDNAIRNNNCDVIVDDDRINIKVNGTIDISLNKMYKDHDVNDCTICFELKECVKLPCSHYICCDCVLYAKDSSIGESMILDKCPYCRKPTNPNLIRIDIN